MIQDLRGEKQPKFFASGKIIFLKIAILQRCCIKKK
jgi:hypothetical protein